jgi:hypothetical protein
MGIKKAGSVIICQPSVIFAPKHSLQLQKTSVIFLFGYSKAHDAAHATHHGTVTGVVILDILRHSGFLLTLYSNYICFIFV